MTIRLPDFREFGLIELGAFALCCCWLDWWMLFVLPTIWLLSLLLFDLLTWIERTRKS